MKIRGRALIIAVVAGFAVQVVLSLISNMIALRSFPAVTGRGGIPGLPTGGSVVTLLACVCVLIVDLAVGLLYAALAAREGTLTAGDGALGGGVAGAIEGLLTGLVGVVITAFLLPRLSTLLGTIPSEYADQAMLGAAVGGLIGGLIGLCLAIVRGAVLAAIGGAIGGAIFKPRGAAPAA